MVKEYFRPKTIEEALELLSAPDSSALAGGTFLLAFEAREKPERLVDLFHAVPGGIKKDGDKFSIAAGTTFQELLESDLAPNVLKNAAKTMANRNTRNRATIGGNIAALRSCSSLVPILLALESKLEYAIKGASTELIPLTDWIAAPKGIILEVKFSLPKGQKVAAIRSSRTACDIATSTAACSYRLENGIIKDLKIALGGFAPGPAFRPDIAQLFEGKPLPSKEEIEKNAAALLKPISDKRGGIDYKRLRGALLVADALTEAEEQK